MEMLKGLMRIVQRNSSREVLKRLVTILEQKKSWDVLKGLPPFLVGGVVGAYGGIYASQNYNVPSVDDPHEMLDKINEFLEEFKKDSKT